MVEVSRDGRRVYVTNSLYVRPVLPGRRRCVNGQARRRTGRRHRGRPAVLPAR
ncbi:MAG TPA: hypothetical protein VIR00_11815 [Micromonosporaceae bacterium]